MHAVQPPLWHLHMLKDNGNAVKILEKLGVDPSKMPEEIIKDTA